MNRSSKFLMIIAAVLVVVIGLMYLIDWKQTVLVPIVKRHSVPCGYGGTSGAAVECACDGFKVADIRMGSTNYYCTDKCSQCKCYQVDMNDWSKTEVDCSTFSDLKWAFPFEEKK